MDENGLLIELSDGPPPLMRVEGELTVENCLGFADVIGDTLDTPGATLALDLAGLEYVDSSGLRELIKAANAARSTGCVLSIISMQPQFEHVLTITDLRHLFAVGEVAADHRALSIPRSVPAADLCFAVESRLDCCREVRDSICGFATGMGFDEPQLSEIRMAVGEAISNAVRHGAMLGDTIGVECRDSEGRILITLSYPSKPFDPAGVPPPDLDGLCEGGMGIHFMRLVMDDLRYHFPDGLAVVTLEKALP